MTKRGKIIYLFSIVVAYPLYSKPHSKSEAHLAAHIKRLYQHIPALNLKKEKYDALWKHYYYHPIPITALNSTKLSAIGIISHKQGIELDRYIATYGPLKSTYELQAVLGWDSPTIESILPFIDPSIPWYKRLATTETKRQTKLFLSLNKLFKKKPKDVLGSGIKTLLTFQIAKKELYRIALIASKEPYEPFYWHGQKSSMYGPLAYWGGYVMLKNIDHFDTIVLGDYQVALGQGLILGSLFAIDKSQEVIKVMKVTQPSIKPHVSAQRKSRYRGLACSYHYGPYQLLFFLSSQYLDITLHQKKGETPYITTLHNRGISYTCAKALEKKNSVHEKIIGTALYYKAPTSPLILGAQVLYNAYSIPINANKGTGHTLFFHGKTNTNLSLFANTLWHNCHLFGEIAQASNHSIAALAGVMRPLTKKLDTALLLYHYPPHFHSLHGNAFGRKGDHNRNKKGFYLALQYRPVYPIQFKAYLDWAQHLVPQKSLHHAPSCEKEIMFSTHYQPSYSHTYNLVLKATQKPKNKKGSSVYAPRLSMVNKVKATAKITYPLNKYHHAYTQIQCTYLQEGQEHHYATALKQLFSYKSQNIQIKGWGMLYRSPTYNTAIRLYTHSLRPGLSYPAHYGDYGLECGMVLRYQIHPTLKIGLRCILNTAMKQNKENNCYYTNPTIKISLQITYK